MKTGRTHAGRHTFIAGQAVDRKPENRDRGCVGIDTPVNHRAEARHAPGCDGKAPDAIGVLEPRSEPCRLAMVAELREKT